jgi:hypothetical protein
MNYKEQKKQFWRQASPRSRCWTLERAFLWCLHIVEDRRAKGDKCCAFSWQKSRRKQTYSQEPLCSGINPFMGVELSPPQPLPIKPHLSVLLFWGLSLPHMKFWRRQKHSNCSDK